MRKALLALALIFVCSQITACGSSSSDDVNFGDNGTDGGNSDSGDLDPTAGALQKSTEFFGQNGNLWKPSGDGHGSSAGQLVVLAGPHHTQRFDTCEIAKRDGTVSQLDCNDRVPWTHEPYSCFANGNRQHWRASFSCHDAAEVKVTCRNVNQEIVFTVPEAARGQVCSRFG